VFDVWFASKFADPPEPAARVDVGGLLHLQQNLLGHYFRLQTTERRLSAQARLRNPRGGRMAIMHMERERQRLGRELHTGVGQMLAAIRLQLELISAQSYEPPEPVRQALGRIHVLAEEALEQVRSVSKRLHPPEWQRLSLESAVRQVWEFSGIPQKYEAILQVQPLPFEPDLDVRVLIYRAVQEALSNLSRHSHATRVELLLEHSNGLLRLRISDNGIGFDVEELFAAPPSVAAGLGLRTIREQAGALGGRFQLNSGSHGTTLEISVPMEPPQV
jgi:two-component system, NarL family, sensor kinase